LLGLFGDAPSALITPFCSAAFVLRGTGLIRPYSRRRRPITSVHHPWLFECIVAAMRRLSKYCIIT
jgi:hypothetical protein